MLRLTKTDLPAKLNANVLSRTSPNLRKSSAETRKIRKKLGTSRNKPIRTGIILHSEMACLVCRTLIYSCCRSVRCACTECFPFGSCRDARGPSNSHPRRSCRLLWLGTATRWVYEELVIDWGLWEFLNG